MKNTEEQNKVDIEILFEISKLISCIECSNLDELTHLILKQINIATSSKLSFVYFKSSTSNTFKLLSKNNSDLQYKNHIICNEISLEKTNNDIYLQLSNNAPYFYNFNSELDIFPLNIFAKQIDSLILFPMIIANELIGFIGVCDTLYFNSFSVLSLNILSNIANYLGISINYLRLQEKNTKLKKKVKSSNAIQSDFLSNISHEIRTPMNAIIGFTELIRNSKNLNDLQINYLNGISKGSQNLLSLINDILDLSKIETNQIKVNLSSIDIRIILDDIKSIFINTSNFKGIKFNISIDNSLPDNLLLDGLRLRQILFNLVGNAIKFTDTGFVELSVKCQKNQNNAYDIFFEVKDTGIGIQSTHIDEIFEAFKQIDAGKRKKYPGTGLGLAISKRLANIMGGTLNVESIEGAGSTFTLSLINILNAANKFTNYDVAEKYKTVKNKSYKIIIADEALTNRQLFKMILRNYNVEILEAVNGKEVLEILSNTKPDILFIEINLPKLNGFETLHNIKLLYPELNVPIIAIIGEKENFDEEAIKSYFNDILYKPFSKDMLLNKLNKTIELCKIKNSNDLLNI